MNTTANASRIDPARGRLNGGFEPGILLFLLIIIVAAYFPTLTAYSLLDEQFLLAWLSSLTKEAGSYGFNTFLNWPGFARFDHWGPLSKLTLFVLSFIFGKTIFWYKLCSVLIHSANTALVYFIARKMNPGLIFAFAAAILFALYPLDHETVAWLGGFGVELGSCFFLGSFFIYISGLEKGLGWGRLAASGICFLLALLCSMSLWPCCLAFGLYQLPGLLPGRFIKSESKQAETEQSGQNTEESKQSKSGAGLPLMAALLPVIIAGACLAGSGMFTYGIEGFKLKEFGQILKCCFLPINELNWQNYSRAYRFYYIFYPFVMLALISGLSTVKSLRQSAIFSFLLLIALSLPFAGIAIEDSSLYGERLLYPLSFAVCLFLSTGLSGLSQLKNKLAYPGIGACLLLTTILSVQFFSHIFNENAADRNRTRQLKAVQKSIRIMQEKEQLQLFIARDLPEKLSIAPSFSPRGPVCFETGTQLLQSGAVPDGRLKEALRENKLTAACKRWQPDLQSFLPLDIGPESIQWQKEISLEEFAGRMEPGVEFYSNIHWNADKTELLLDSNSDKGPMFTFNSSELSTLDGDFLFVDAQIDAPTSFAAPRLELHWQTRLHKDFEKKERFCYTNAITNDGQFHRYLLSLRSNGWTTGGVPRLCALGFPAGAKVRLNKVGIIQNQNLIPSLEAAESAKPDQSPKRFIYPYFNFPNSKELGLMPLAPDQDAINCNYDAGMIEGAAAVLVEISQANKSFDDANSNHLSGQTLKTFRQENSRGSIKVPLASLPENGVYSLRIIALNAAGAYTGQFSDPLSFQVRVKESGSNQP